MSLNATQAQQLTAVVNWMNEVIANSKINEEMTIMNPFDRNILMRGSLSGLSKTFTLAQFVDEISQDFVLGNVPVEFKHVEIDYNAPGTITNKIKTAVNSMPNFVLNQGTVYYFFVIRLVLTNGDGIGTSTGPSFAIIKEHFAFRKKVPPNADGVASIGIDGTPVSDFDFYPSFILDSREFAPIEFDLGNIGSSAINDAVDASGPYSTPNVTTIIFKAVQGGVEKGWIFIGEAEEVGIGFPATSLTDYRQLDANDIDPPPTNYIYPIYTPDTESTIAMQSRLGNYCNMENPSTEDSFDLETNSADADTGGQLPPFATWARVLWDGTGKTEYAGIKGKWIFTLSGTSGSAIISIGSNDYTVTFNTNLNTTAANFVTNEAANILAGTGLVVTSQGDNITLKGVNEELISIANATGNLSALLDSLEPKLISSPDFQEGLFDLFVLCDGFRVVYKFVPRENGITSGGGAVSSVNGETGVVVLDADDIDDSATTNKFTTAERNTKVDHLTVTQAVNLDEINSRVNELDASLILKGVWDASAGTFPGGGTAQAGHSYIVSVAGIVDGVSFNINDRIIAIVDNASTGTYAANWHKADYTDEVLSVAGRTGAVIITTADLADFVSAVRSTVLTGLSLVTATAISATDSVLGALGKLQAQITALPSAIQTLTNKRITMRVQSVVSAATVTPNADNDDAVKITAQAEALSLANPSGTPTSMQPMTIRIKDNGTARAITYGSQYRAIGVTLPTTTVIGKTTYIGMVWNSDDSKWDVVGTNTQE